VASQVYQKRLPNNSPIFSVEAHGILLALDMSTGNQLLFLSGSLSCLQSLQNQDLSHALIAEILCCVQGLISGGISFVSMWVPSHVGLAGDSSADISAEAALLLPVSNLTVAHSDYNSHIRTRALKQWQLRWNSEIESNYMRLNQGGMYSTFSVYHAEMRILFTGYELDTHIFRKDTWVTHNFLSSWSEATVIPIPKPGKDPTDPGNYKPIALTSCLCKTFERLINW
jgi:hypothetical protein